MNLVKKREEMLGKFIPGQRRPWALSQVELPGLDGKIAVIDFKQGTHNEIIKSFYKTRGTGEGQMLEESYVFTDGLLEKIRQSHMDYWDGDNLSDFHAFQLWTQLKKMDVDIKEYAIIGPGTTGGQAISAFYLLPENAKIHIFEFPTKIADIKKVMGKMGLAEVFGKKIFFHAGNVAETLPATAKLIGGFDLIESQLVIQHMRGDDFINFCRAMSTSLRKGGLVKVNELMLFDFGLTSGEDDSVTMEARSAVEKYCHGDGASDGLSFLKFWDWPNGGHAWRNRDNFVADIQKFAEDLIIRPDLEMTRPAQDITYGSNIWIGMRYVIITLASALTAKAQMFEKTNLEMAKKFEFLAKWAWDEGEKIDSLVTGDGPFKEGKFTINFPEIAGVVFEKQ